MEQTPGTVVGIAAGVSHKTVNIGEDIADTVIAFPVEAREFRSEEQK